jgi:hypothetical protein
MIGIRSNWSRVVVSGIPSNYIEIERRAELFTSSANIAIVRVFVLNIFVSLCR